jgi:hypothetical protein
MTILSWKNVFLPYKFLLYVSTECWHFHCNCILFDIKILKPKITYVDQYLVENIEIFK